jgi:hypothetical protein
MNQTKVADGKKTASKIISSKPTWDIQEEEEEEEEENHRIPP